MQTSAPPNKQAAGTPNLLCITRRGPARNVPLQYKQRSNRVSYMFTSSFSCVVQYQINCSITYCIILFFSHPLLFPVPFPFPLPFRFPSFFLFLFSFSFPLCFCFPFSLMLVFSHILLFLSALFWTEHEQTLQISVLLSSREGNILDNWHDITIFDKLDWTVYFRVHSSELWPLQQQNVSLVAGRTKNNDSWNRHLKFQFDFAFFWSFRNS